jgi:hypothetical protein
MRKTKPIPEPTHLNDENGGMFLLDVGIRCHNPEDYILQTGQCFSGDERDSTSLMPQSQYRAMFLNCRAAAQ